MSQRSDVSAVVSFYEYICINSPASAIAIQSVANASIAFSYSGFRVVVFFWGGGMDGTIFTKA